MHKVFRIVVHLPGFLTAPTGIVPVLSPFPILAVIGFRLLECVFVEQKQSDEMGFLIVLRDAFTDKHAVAEHAFCVLTVVIQSVQFGSVLHGGNVAVLQVDSRILQHQRTTRHPGRIRKQYPAEAILGGRFLRLRIVNSFVAATRLFYLRHGIFAIRLARFSGNENPSLGLNPLPVWGRFQNTVFRQEQRIQNIRIRV